MGEVTDTIKNQMQEDARREGNAFRKSGPWFLAFVVVLALGVGLYALGAEIPGGVLAVVGLILLPYAVHKHGQAGGDDASMIVGMSSE